MHGLSHFFSLLIVLVVSAMGCACGYEHLDVCFAGKVTAVDSALLLSELGESLERIVQQHQALQEANDKLERLSQIDVLTGLANHRYFDQQYSLEYARYLRADGELSVLVVDIDYFKSINDHYDHIVGDGCLQEIASVLKAEMSRPNDLAWQRVCL